MGAVFRIFSLMMSASHSHDYGYTDYSVHLESFLI
jgi:hypothetical protein